MKHSKLDTHITLFESISSVDKLLFTRHLAVMLKSGIPLVEALSIVQTQSKKQTFRDMVKNIRTSVSEGKNFSKALSKYPHVFDSFYISLIEIAEESGTLVRNLEYLSEQIRKNYDFKKKVTGALMYPAIILVTAFVAGTGISIFVLPKLVTLFESLEVELPITTRILLWFSGIMKNDGLFILAGIILLFFLVKIVISLETVKPHWHKFLLSLPVLGTFFQDVELANFCRNFGIMLSSGLPITTALLTLSESTSNYVYRKYFKSLQENVVKGKSLQDSFDAKKFKYIPLIATKMIGVGEKSGKLDESLNYLGEFFEEEVENTSKNFSTVLEPIVLIFVGLIVAFLAISIISPIYQFTGSIKR